MYSNCVQGLLPPTTGRSQTKNGLESLEDMHEIGYILANSSSRRLENYKPSASSYSVTRSLPHVEYTLENMKQVLSETEARLEEQIRLTDLEKKRCSRMEESLHAESLLREEAESNNQIYNSILKQTKSEYESKLAKVDCTSRHIAQSLHSLHRELKDMSQDALASRVEELIKDVAELSNLEKN